MSGGSVRVPHLSARAHCAQHQAVPQQGLNRT